MHFSGCSVLPAKSEHAVQAVVFVCELPAGVSPEAVGRLIHHYDATPGLRNAFPRKTEIRGMSIAVSPGSVDVQHGGDVTGVTLDRVAPNGAVETAVSLQGNVLSFTCNLYSRWSLVSGQAISLLTELASFVLPEPGIVVFGLQYIDEFYVTGDQNAFHPSMLFSTTGGRIPTFLNEQVGPWHNHSGWFEKDDATGVRTLNNMNINVVSQPEKLLVQIVSAHRNIMPAPASSREELSNVIGAQFDSLHTQNKKLLGELLTATAQDAIHLERSQ